MATDTNTTGSAAPVAGPTLLERAQALDWPTVLLRTAVRAGGSEQAWRLFTKAPTPEDQQQAEAAMGMLERGAA